LCNLTLITTFSKYKIAQRQITHLGNRYRPKCEWMRLAGKRRPVRLKIQLRNLGTPILVHNGHAFYRPAINRPRVSLCKNYHSKPCIFYSNFFQNFPSLNSNRTDIFFLQYFASVWVTNEALMLITTKVHFYQTE